MLLVKLFLVNKFSLILSRPSAAGINCCAFTPFFGNLFSPSQRQMRLPLCYWPNSRGACIRIYRENRPAANPIFISFCKICKDSRFDVTTHNGSISAYNRLLLRCEAKREQGEWERGRNQLTSKLTLFSFESGKYHVQYFSLRQIFTPIDHSNPAMFQFSRVLSLFNSGIINYGSTLRSYYNW